VKRLTLTAHERGVLRSAQATSERNRKRPITLRSFEQTNTNSRVTPSPASAEREKAAPAQHSSAGAATFPGDAR
jgi:hypothetical protein